MILHEITTALALPATHFALQAYSHQVETFTRLITYLAAISIGMWALVMFTMFIRAGAHRYYNQQRLRRKL